MRLKRGVTGPKTKKKCVTSGLIPLLLKIISYVSRKLLLTKRAKINEMRGSIQTLNWKYSFIKSVMLTRVKNRAVPCQPYLVTSRRYEKADTFCK
mmetsp:Transcript_12644/g.15706  ORF Transcript_12644/g.15706 Transcript_12644/m.15706 type:complete len:95 (-) Transcript_12644:2698-2982(-)